jgi:hypothetical protein
MRALEDGLIVSFVMTQVGVIAEQVLGVLFEILLSFLTICCWHRPRFGRLTSARRRYPADGPRHYAGLEGVERKMMFTATRLKVHGNSRALD